MKTQRLRDTDEALTPENVRMLVLRNAADNVRQYERGLVVFVNTAGARYFVFFFVFIIFVSFFFVVVLYEYDISCKLKHV